MSKTAEGLESFHHKDQFTSLDAVRVHCPIFDGRRRSRFQSKTHPGYCLAGPDALVDVYCYPAEVLAKSLEFSFSAASCHQGLTPDRASTARTRSGRSKIAPADITHSKHRQVLRAECKYLTREISGSERSATTCPERSGQ